jgi:hypothetical protein
MKCLDQYQLDLFKEACETKNPEMYLKVYFDSERCEIEKERNEILKSAFAVQSSAPSALEAIAMQLGFKTQGDNTITDAIQNIAQAIEEK